MKKILPKLALALLPIALYLAVFLAFEPNNYFSLRSDVSDNSPIARMRAYMQDPQDNIILGDSRMAHFDLDLVEETFGEPFANVSYGGASLAESIDQFYVLYAQNPDLERVVFGISFYTLNNNYRTANRMSTIETQLENPVAYIFNLEYNVNTLTAISDALLGNPSADEEETAEHTPDEYVDENGEALAFRANLMAYADTITPVCTDYAINEESFADLLTLIDFCEAEGVALTLVFPPMDESVRVLVCEPLGIDLIMADALDILYARGTTILDYEWENAPDYVDTQFYDGFHLDTQYGLPDWTKTLFSEVM